MQTLKEFANEIRLHPETVRGMANRGICGCKIAGRWRFTDDDLNRVKEAPWRSTGEVKSGTSSFSFVEREYADLLRRATER